ncbi:MAG: hypothetical protein ACXADC_00420 [Candidatus Thorarchaeota archaeon]|jgi:hypothetical protein
MTESHNDVEYESGKPVAGIGCYMGIRGLALLILLMCSIAALASIVILVHPLFPLNVELGTWILGLTLLGVGFIVGHLFTLFYSREK